MAESLKNASSAMSDVERIVQCLRQISHLSFVHSRYLQKKFDVTGSQLLCLRALHKEDGLPASEIGRRVFIKPGTITGILDRLEIKGLVNRVRNSPDRRVINIRITDAGRKLVEEAPIPVQSLLAGNLESLPKDDVKNITESLERLLDLMKWGEMPKDMAIPASDETIF